MLWNVRKGIENKLARIVIPPYRPMVQPHLEYCLQFKSSYLKTYFAELGKLQKRTNKTIKLEYILYEERQKSLGVFNLENKCLREYVI